MTLGTFTYGSSVTEALADFEANLRKELEGRLAQEKIIIALSGGSTPFPFYRLLKDLLEEYDLNNKVVFIQVDERNVPLDSPESNGGKLKEIFEQYDLRLMNPTERTPEECQAEVLSLLEGHEKIDFSFFGLGEDGHFASLFPESEGLSNHTDTVIKNWVPTKGEFRYTLTYSVLEKVSKSYFFIENKPEKNWAINQLLCLGDIPVSKFVKSKGMGISWIIFNKND